MLSYFLLAFSFLENQTILNEYKKPYYKVKAFCILGNG